MTNQTEFDVIVIGAGLAGLAAGATATAAGSKTLVLDAHQPGGRARVTERDGFRFNMGAHALYRGGPGMEVLDALGVRVEGGAPDLSRYRVLAGGRLHRLPAGPSSMMRTTAMGARGKAQLVRLLAGLARMRPADHAGTSAEDWIAARELRPDAEGVVRALIRISTYAGDPAAISADAVITQLQAASSSGVLYLHGGWTQLIEGLSARTAVRTGARVDAVEPFPGGVEVRAGDERLTARAAVVAAGGPAACRAVLPADPGWGDLGPEVTAACLDAGTSRVPDPGYVLGIDRPVYTTVQSPPGRQCPEGQAVVASLRYGARSADVDRADLEANMALAGVRPEDVVTSRFLARMVVAGAAPRAGSGGLAGRPRVDATGDGRLFVAGDWVGERGLIADAALASGQEAGRRAAEAAAGAVRPRMTAA